MPLEPFALTFALLVFWIGLGWSLIATVEPGMHALKALFLAPAIGVAVTLLPVFWLNLAGLPVATFARPLLEVLCCALVGAWMWRRPTWTARELIFLIPVIGALFLFGFPSLRFGFDWVGNANDDWANYNLSAIRFLKSGFFSEPSIEAMRDGSNYPGFLWFLEVAEDSRPGSELLLAWVSAIVGKNPFFIFMPVILAFHGVFVFAAAGLAMASIRQRSVLFAALILTAIAPLSLYAVHQQLIAQVIGLAFMCTTACLTFVRLHELRCVGRIALTSVIVPAYWLLYPETVPFFVVAFLVFHLSHLRTKEWGWEASWSLFIPLVVASLVLGTYAVSFVYYILSQLHGSAAQGVFDGVSIFPYFLVPSGLTVLFGFSRLGELMDEPWLSLSIGAAIALLVFLAIGIVLGLKRKSSIASYLVVVGVVAVFLVKQHNDFGVFKVAMFAQAFLWFAIVATLIRIRSTVQIMAYVLVFSTVVLTDLKYTRLSLQDTAGGGNLIAGASRDRLLTRVLVDQADRACEVNYDTSNPPLIKVLGAMPGCARSFIARPKLFGSIASAAMKSIDINPLHQVLGITSFSARVAMALSPELVYLSFPYAPLDNVPILTTKPVVEYSKTFSDVADDSIFNEQARASDDPYARANLLVLANSSLGSHYYLPDFGITAVFQTEPDIFFSGGKLAAIGRYLLFRIQSPTKSPRLVLDLTTSLLADGLSNLPPAVVVGETAVPIGLLGHGAARVISPPVTPLVVDGVPYLLLDLGAKAKLLDVPRSGLMKLYGTEVPIDYRRLVAFARSIRLVDEEAPNLAVIPSKVDRFPSDLANKNLEFSGIYEDGWVGDNGFVVLSSSNPSKAIFRGLFSNGLGLDGVDLTVDVEGGASVRKHLEPGPFELEVPAKSGKSRIGFHFSAIGRLPSGDNRPAVALLSSVALESGATESPKPSKSANLPKGIEGVGVKADGLFSDGWLAQKSFVVVNSAHDGKAVLRGMVPGNLGLDGQTIELMTDVGDVVRMKLKPGPFEIEIPVKAGHSKVSISFSQTANLPNGDGRNVAALLQLITLTPTAE
jgi:hypothetical protein